MPKPHVNVERRTRIATRRVARLSLHDEPEDVPLPEQDRTELSILLYGRPGPVAHFAEDEVSAATSQVSTVCSSPQMSPTTPTPVSSYPSPQILSISPDLTAEIKVDSRCEQSTEFAPAVEKPPENGESVSSQPLVDTPMSGPQQDQASNPDSFVDEGMADTGEDLQGDSTQDESMEYIAEDDLDGLFGDVTMFDTSEDFQSAAAEDVEMVLTRGDGSAPEEQSPDSAMEDMSIDNGIDDDSHSRINDIASGPVPKDEEMEDFKSTTTVSRPKWDINDHSYGIWRELADLGETFHTDLRKLEGSVKDSILNMQPKLHEKVVQDITRAKSAVALIRLLKSAEQNNTVSEHQLEVLRDRARKSQSANNVSTSNATTQPASLSNTELFQNLSVPPLVPMQNAVDISLQEPVNEPFREDFDEMEVDDDLADPIWNELENLGPGLYKNLKRKVLQDDIQKAVYLHNRTIPNIFRDAATPHALMELIKLRHRAKQLTLHQARVIRGCVLHFRSTNPDDAMKDESPPKPAQKSAPEKQPKTDSFFSDVPQQHFQSAQLPSPELSNKDAPHAEKLLELLYDAYETFTTYKKSLKRFAAMFSMPWNDRNQMKRIVDSVIEFKTDLTKVSATSFVQDMSTRNGRDIIYSFITYASASECVLRQAPVKYTHRRRVQLARVFQTIARSNLSILEAQSREGCLSWQAVQDLAVYEEAEIFHRGKTPQIVLSDKYQLHINSRLKHWCEAEELGKYIKQQNGDGRLIVGSLMPKPAVKRGGSSDGKSCNLKTFSGTANTSRRRIWQRLLVRADVCLKEAQAGNSCLAHRPNEQIANHHWNTSKHHECSAATNPAALKTSTLTQSNFTNASKVDLISTSSSAATITVRWHIYGTLILCCASFCDIMRHA